MLARGSFLPFFLLPKRRYLLKIMSKYIDFFRRNMLKRFNLWCKISTFFRKKQTNKTISIKNKYRAGANCTHPCGHHKKKPPSWGGQIVSITRKFRFLLRKTPPPKRLGTVLFNGVNYCLECLRLVHREVSQNLTVKLDTLRIYLTHKL